MHWFKIAVAAVYAGGLAPRTLYAAAQRGDLRVARIGAGRNLLTCDEWVDEWLSASAEERSNGLGSVGRRGKSELDERPAERAGLMHRLGAGGES